MSVLHQCNNCGRTQPSELSIQMEMAMPTIADPPDLEFCSWSCVAAYAQKRMAARG